MIAHNDQFGAWHRTLEGNKMNGIAPNSVILIFSYILYGLLHCSHIYVYETNLFLFVSKLTFI